MVYIQPFGNVMARRRSDRSKSIFSILMQSDWRVAAGFALASLVVGGGVMPALLAQNRFLVALAPMATMAGVGFGVLFLVIALLRYTTAARQRQSIPNPTTVFPARRPAAQPAPRGEDRIAAAWEASTAVHVAPAPEPPDAWSLDLLQALEWKRFEDLCCAYYEAKGISARTTPLGPDGGIDIHLFQDDPQPMVATSVVQCKAWATQRVGIKPLRELLGVMAAERIGKGFFMTVGSYTDEAKAFAQKNGIIPLDGKLILAMLKRLPPDAQQRLLNTATDGDYTTPTCVSCGVKMVARNSQRGAFWGCRNFPRCRQKLTMRRVE